MNSITLLSHFGDLKQNLAKLNMCLEIMKFYDERMKGNKAHRVRRRLSDLVSSAKCPEVKRPAED